MSLPDLVSSYSTVGDIICTILCLCLLFLIKFSIVYYDDIKFKYVVKSIISVLFAAIANIGFYMDPNGLWHDPTYLKPFTITYIMLMLEIGGLLIFYQKKLSSRLFSIIFLLKSFVLLF